MNRESAVRHFARSFARVLGGVPFNHLRSAEEAVASKLFGSTPAVPLPPEIEEELRGFEVECVEQLPLELLKESARKVTPKPEGERLAEQVARNKAGVNQLGQDVSRIDQEIAKILSDFSSRNALIDEGLAELVDHAHKLDTMAREAFGLDSTTAEDS
jgi:hypothetical protein